MSEGTEIWNAQAAVRKLEARVAELERILLTKRREGVDYEFSGVINIPRDDEAR